MSKDGYKRSPLQCLEEDLDVDMHELNINVSKTLSSPPPTPPFIETPTVSMTNIVFESNSSINALANTVKPDPIVLGNLPNNVDNISEEKVSISSTNKNRNCHIYSMSSTSSEIVTLQTCLKMANPHSPHIR